MPLYAVVGVLATAVHYLVLVMLVEVAGMDAGAAAGAGAACGALVGAGTSWLGLPYLLPQAVATALVFAGGYVLNRRWSFA